MIEEIKSALKKDFERVIHGIARTDDSGTWDCILIRKERIEKSGTSKLDHTRYVSVRIIWEDEIPEGAELMVINQMKEIGWKRSGTPIEFEYAMDANEVVVEIAKIEFCRPEKRVC